jgi:hypothetical protein
MDRKNVMGIWGTLLVILGTAIATIGGILLFLRILFATLEKVDYDVDYEMDKYYETKRR